jgi:hypothetical protein
MAKVEFVVSIDEDKAEILQAAADIQGVPASKLLDNGASLDGIVNDQVYQSLSRLRSTGTIPAEIRAEIKTYAAAQVANRAAANRTLVGGL